MPIAGEVGFPQGEGDIVELRNFIASQTGSG
jgi:hypothetical protein